MKVGTLMHLTCFIFFLKFIEMLWSFKKYQKIGIGRGLARLRTKHLFPQTLVDKILGTKWSNPVKLDRKRKVWYMILRVF